MGLIMRNLTFLVILVLVACNGNGPPPPPPPPPECAVWSAPEGCNCPDGTPFASTLGVCAPPRVDRLIDFGAVRGLTAFSTTHRTLEEQVDYIYRTHEKGWTTHRVGAQARWPQSCGTTDLQQVLDPEFIPSDDIIYQMAAQGYLPCGPPHKSPEADANLVRLLEVTARIPNTWVQLIPSFTYKHVDKGSSQENIEFFNRMFDHVNFIISKGDYKHVIYELFNEVIHPISSHLSEEDVEKMFIHARSETWLPVSTDHHGVTSTPKWLGRYPGIWRRRATYIAFHTPRNPEPSFNEIKESQERFGYTKPVLVDEIVCWASDRAITKYNLRNKGTIAEKGYGTEESRMAQCVRHLRDLHWNNWKGFFHMIWGIHGYHIGEMPDYDRDIKGES